MILTVANVIQNLTERTQNGKTHLQWIFAILLNISVLNTGLYTGWPAYAAKVLQSEKSPIGSPLSTLDISWLTSSPNLAAMLSVPLWTILVDKYGRKNSAICNAFLHVVCWVTIMLAASKVALMAGRIVGGVSDTGSSYIISMYVKELTQDDLRGTLGLMRNLARNTGILAIYLMGGYLTYSVISRIALLISIIGMLGVLICPESPTYYIKIGKIEIAAVTIATLRNLKADAREVQCVLDSIKAEDEKFKSIQNTNFIGICKQKAWFKGLIYMILLVICQSTCGGYAIINYAPTILEMLKVTVKPELQSLSVPIFMLIGSLLSMVFIERIGRKPILLASFLVSLVSFSVLAGILMLHNQGVETPDWLAVSMLVLPIFAYAAGIYPMPFVIMAEMFNFQIRAKMMGFVCVVSRVCAFVQTLIFGPMSSAFGPHATFILYAGVNLCGALLVIILLPETKRKTVEEIELELEK